MKGIITLCLVVMFTIFNVSVSRDNLDSSKMGVSVMSLTDIQLAVASDGEEIPEEPEEPQEPEEPEEGSESWWANL